jgi:hypothetical protein
MGCRETVRRPCVIDFLGALDQAGRLFRRIFDGNDLIILAVQDQGRYVKLLEIFSLVSLRKALMLS